MATKTLVTTFEDAHEAEAAVHALHEAGFARDDLGWVSKSPRTGAEIASGSASSVRGSALEGAGVGAGLGGLAGLLIGFAALGLPGIGPVVLAGPLVSALAGAGIGAAAGGIVDALTHLGVPRDEAHRHAERLRKGGAMVTVTVDDEEEEALALSILRGEAVDRGHDVVWRVPADAEEPSLERPSAQSIV
ncbi:MAG: hypothetical protein HYV09_10180 [Deltaproteobacteria bacterium]|nr:hypothetical protein [Deltaproteobacteria bacterium]